MMWRLKFVSNDPVNFVDSLGLFEFSWSEGDSICWMTWDSGGTVHEGDVSTATAVNVHTYCFQRSGLTVGGGPILDPLAPLEPLEPLAGPGLQLPFKVCSVVEGTVSSGLQVGGEIKCRPAFGRPSVVCVERCRDGRVL